jgi:hypothetical protein
MALIIQKPVFNIASGDHNFDPVQISSDRAIVQVFYASIAVSDVGLELHQSTNGVGFDLVEDSAVVVDKNKPSHSWTVHGLVRGVFLRVKVIKGTAAAGVINTINYLYE